MSLREGSLFTGYNGLGMAVSEVFGSEPAWFSEIEDAPSKILAHHWPDVPNLGDITQIDWDQVEPVDILSGGFPCQDVSLAGKRAGMTADTRSGLWSYFAEGIGALRPQYIAIENVRGLLSAEAHSDVEPCPWCLGDGPGEPALRALGAVLGDLADLGYDAQWCGLRAADVGAPHGRYRVFVLAEDADVSAGSERWLAAPGQTEGGWPWADAGGRDRAPAANADDTGWQQHGWPVAVRPELATAERRGDPTADADRYPVREQPVSQSGRGGASITGLAGDAATHADNNTAGDGRLPAEAARSRTESAQRGATAADAPGNGRHEGWSEPAGELRGSDAAECGASATAWGQYRPAVERWERALGRVAPAPTEPNSKGSQRLNPAFVEWMMGLPAGHVTAVPGVNRNAQLKALGNGVVPQQAVAALRHLEAA